MNASVAQESPPPLDESRRAVARTVRFISESATTPYLPSAVGALAGDVARSSAPDSAALTRAFRDAYVDAVFRGISLEGALGGDRVNRWLPNEGGAYVQNWRSGTPFPNSWGLPSLVLAARSVEGDRVFVVKNAVLDAYGRGEGVGRANGVAGYGAPLSDEFSFAGGIAQRFERGLIVIAEEGIRRFLQEGSTAATVSPSDRVGAFDKAPPAGFTEADIAAAFRSAWKAAVNRDRGPADADGSVRAVVVPAPQSSPSVQAVAPTEKPTDFFVPEGETKARPPSRPVRVETVLLQTYGETSWALALPIGEGTGMRARLLIPPFLDLLLLEGSWEAAFAKYGAPLTDPFPGEGKTVQRFSQGWMETE